MRVVLMVLVLTLVCFEGFAATYIKVSDEKVGIVTEVSQEYTIAEIKHEIQGIQNDLIRIEASKQPFLDRLAKYEDMLANCSAMGIKEPVKVVDEIKPIEPVIEEEHTI